MMYDNPKKDFIGETESKSEPGCKNIKRRRDTVVTANADPDTVVGLQKGGRQSVSPLVRLIRGFRDNKGGSLIGRTYARSI